ncbi:FAD-binding domain-containing protein [Xylariomycetidae sp. FL2044]|nr:FAD-binding domain-containing protein [Xylariomycetidae sp. FL2044]
MASEEAPPPAPPPPPRQKRQKLASDDVDEEGKYPDGIPNDGLPIPLPVVWRDSTEPDAFYEAAWGRVFNRRRDDKNTTQRTPRAVVRASTPEHVRRAVELAGREGCRVSVRSGGHSWAAWSVRRDAVLIDLGELKHVAYDRDTKIATCSPSTTGEQLNEFLEGEGRLFAGGHCPDVGLGGFLLQGGMGWVCRSWGWACESIVGMDVVTADAREIYVSAVENADLFWAARGAGPGFPGVVTRFHLLTRPALEMYNCIYVYPVKHYRRVLQWVIDVSTDPKTDENTEIVCVSRRVPDGEGIQIIAGFTSFQPSQQQAEKALRPVHEGRPEGAEVALFCDPTSLANEYREQVRAQPPGYRYCSENAYVADDADVPAVLEPAFTTLPAPMAFALYFAMAPTSRRPLPDMALSMQSDHYFALYTVWDDAADDARCTAWVHDIMRRVERQSVGSYLGDADFRHRRTRFWSEEKGGKLMAIRRKWDPEGRICGYLDAEDTSGVEGLKNEFEWTDRLEV